jgi:hypothetical protein
VSQTFEAVALKKAAILSPPEIYAEMAHHGRNGRAGSSWRRVLQTQHCTAAHGHQATGSPAAATMASACACTGEEKAKFHWSKVALLSIQAGMYVGFGFTLCLLVGGNAPR